MDPPLEKTHNSLPLIPNPFSFWNGLRPKKEELDAMWVEGLGVHAIPLPQAAWTGQLPERLGTPSPSTTLSGLTLPPPPLCLAV